ncbi:MAG: minor capsid protein [Oscillospiraceae bacterium]
MPDYAIFLQQLAERLDANRSEALRLIRTESIRIHNTVELDAYNECGFEEYEFMASLGERTCEVCGCVYGKRIKLADKQFGINLPPLHPNCRCTTIAFAPDDDLTDFRAG